jgi:hypothetical protein
VARRSVHVIKEFFRLHQLLSRHCFHTMPCTKCHGTTSCMLSQDAGMAFTGLQKGRPAAHSTEPLVTTLMIRLEFVRYSPSTNDAVTSGNQAAAKFGCMYTMHVHNQHQTFTVWCCSADLNDPCAAANPHLKYSIASTYSDLNCYIAAYFLDLKDLGAAHDSGGLGNSLGLAKASTCQRIYTYRPANPHSQTLSTCFEGMNLKSKV